MKTFAANLTVLLVTLLFGFLLMELGLRAVDGKPVFTWRNWIGHEFVQQNQTSFSVYDPVLGWTMTPNLSHDVMSTLDHGIRSNGPGDTVETGGILAVGDSFTAGSEVVDTETWPAYLEGLLGIHVNNAGAGGYGVDQAILRAEGLLDDLQPDLVLLGIFDQDIFRVGYSFYGRAKPWFVLVDGRLQSRNIPVPLPGETELVERPGWVTVIGYSYVVDRILAVAAPQVRLPHTYVREDIDEVDVTCAMIKRLRDRLWSDGVPMAAVFQYGAQIHIREDPRPEYANLVLECLADFEIPVVDEFETIRAVAQRSIAELKELYVMHQEDTVYGHMSAAGNRVVAKLIAETLAPMPTVPTSPAVPVHDAKIAMAAPDAEPDAGVAVVAELGFSQIALAASVLETKPGGAYRLSAAQAEGESYGVLYLPDVEPGTYTLEIGLQEPTHAQLRLQLIDGKNVGGLVDFDFTNLQFRTIALGQEALVTGSLQRADGGFVVQLSADTAGSGMRAILQLLDAEGRNAFASDGQAIEFRYARLLEGRATQTLARIRSFDGLVGDNPILVVEEERSGWFGGPSWPRLRASGPVGEHYMTLGPWHVPAATISVLADMKPDDTCHVRLQVLNQQSLGVGTNFNLCEQKRASSRYGSVRGLSTEIRQLDDGWLRLRSAIQLPQSLAHIKVQLLDENGENSYAPDGESVLLRQVEVVVAR